MLLTPAFGILPLVLTIYSAFIPGSAAESTPSTFNELKVALKQAGFNAPETSSNTLVKDGGRSCASSVGDRLTLNL